MEAPTDSVSVATCSRRGARADAGALRASRSESPLPAVRRTWQAWRSLSVPRFVRLVVSSNLESQMTGETRSVPPALSPPSLSLRAKTRLQPASTRLLGECPDAAGRGRNEPRVLLLRLHALRRL